MAGQDTSSFDEVLKTVYEGGIRELIPTKVRTLEMFDTKDAKPWGGRYVEYPLRVGRNQGSGWATEKGNLPTAGAQKYTDVRIPMRYQYGRITLSAQVMKQSQGARNAFAPAMSQEMDGIIKDMSSDRGRAIMHDGRGVLALVNGTAATNTTQTVDSPGGVAGATNGSRFLNPGEIVACINPATGQLRANSVGTIATVPAAGTTVTLTSAVSWTDNDYIVRAQTTGITDVSDTGFNKEMMGLLGLIDDGTYVATLHNVNRTTYPLFGSYVLGSVTGLSADAIQRVIDATDERGEGEISDLVMYSATRRSYMAMMESDRRYQGSDLMRPDAGTAAAKRRQLTFGGIPITEEKYCPYGMIFVIDRSGFSEYELVAGEWADEDGAILCRIGTGSSAQDAFEAFYRIWDNFANDKPNACGRLDGVSSNIVVTHVD